MGATMVLEEEFEEKYADKNLFTENEKLKLLAPISSTPFQVDFSLPVVKLAQGDGFSVALTAEGKVYTWGSNMYGQLGINRPDVHVQLRPDPAAPLVFKDEAFPEKRVNIIDIACCMNGVVALTDENKVFVWGRRMGKYASVDELTLAYVEKRGQLYNCEVNQSRPRQVGDNLNFHKVVKVFASSFNVALVTDKGELLLHGWNDFGQMNFPKEISEHLKFFPDFMKIDALKDFRVQEVAIGRFTIHVLCSDGSVFGWGANTHG